MTQKMTLKTKPERPKGIDALIDALPIIHDKAGTVAKIFNDWDDDQEIAKTDLDEIDKWFKRDKCGDTYKIARCTVRCIYDNWLICDKDK